MKLSIIIVNYNTAHFVNQTINSVLNSNLDLEHEIIVIDNNSIDESCNIIKKNFKDIYLIKNNKNLGFSKAVNKAVKKSKGEVILLLNPDTIVESFTIKKLYDFLLEDENRGIIGSKIINPDGKFQLSSRRAYPGIFTSICQVTGLSYLFPRSKFFGKYNYTYISNNSTHEVDSISGACMTFKRSLFNELKGFDEDYFLFFEETDFCIRAKKIGKKVCYYPKAITIHYRGESMKTAPFNISDIFYESLRTFYRKNGANIFSSLFFRPFIYLSYKIRSITLYIKKNSRFLIKLLLDVSSIIFSFAISLPLWYSSYYNMSINSDEYVKHFPLLLNYIVAWLLISSLSSLYKRDFLVMRNIILANIFALLVSSTSTFFINTIAYSRGILFFVFIMTFLFTMLWRYLFSFYKKYNAINLNKFENIFFRRVAFIGSGPSIKKIHNRIANSKSIYKTIIGYFDYNNKNIDIEYLGNFETIKDIISAQNIDELIISEADLNKYKLFKLLEKISSTSITLKIIPKKENLLISKGMIEFIDDLPLVEIDFPYYDKKHSITKRIFDIIFSSIFIFITIPLHIYFYSLGKLSKVDIYIEKNKIIKATNYISKYSTVEKMPYLFLILFGKLSFVGSRIIYNEAKIDAILLKPGITGLYKLNREKLLANNKYDHYYLENYSLLLDIEIIFKTLRI
jgi:GT2 family glycosyltransferase/lipopolysaccharide/colanic/teichoic acid biosynthesis glycosyltransferase